MRPELPKRPLRRETEARGGNQPNLNGDLLRKQVIPVPALRNQKRVVEILNDREVVVQRLAGLVDAQTKIIDGLPATLFRYAFTGMT